MKHLVHFLAAAALAALSACSKTATDDQTATTAAVKSDKSLTQVIGGDNRFKTLAGDLRSTGLDGVFSGKGDYTLLAPTEAAFSALGDKGAGLEEPDRKAVLAAVLRSHIIPGMVTAQDIGKAIDANHGKPVSMRTMGTGKVHFARSGADLTVTADDGSVAKLAGGSLSAKNGAVLPVDAVLKKV